MMRAVQYVFASLFFLLITKTSRAQGELSDVQSKLASYSRAEEAEKLFLHTDKNFYVAGEIVWFKLYVVDAAFNKPLSASKVAYVEIIDKNKIPVYRTKIALNEKGGDGSILLPFGLRSGYYTIRAYTNWMKNLGAESFFEKEITIANPLKSPEAHNEKDSNAYSLQLFPEGGNLVNGLASRIAFHLTKSGKGASGQGYLLNANNDTLSSFVPYKFGMGHFDLTPQNGNAYKLVFKLDDGSTVSQPVPHSFEAGYVMHLEESPDKIRITVKTSIRGSYSEVFLLVQARQIVKAARKNLLTDSTAVFTIDKTILGEGINVFTVFDKDRKPVCERLFFVPPQSSKQITLQPSKGKYTTRGKVDLSIISPGGSQENMSLSVYQLDELETSEPVTIDQYLWLTSELKGSIEQPAFYFSASNEEVRQTTDYLMMTHGWRRFDWEAVLNQIPVVKFEREQVGQIITGRVIDTRNNATVKGIQVFLSIPNSPQKLFTSVSDSNGLVQFEVTDFFGPGEVIAQTNWQNDSFYKVEIFSPFAEPSAVNKLPTLAFSIAQQDALLNRSIGMQTQHIYSSDSIDRFFSPALADTFPFYGSAMYSYKLDDYRRFNTMEEVLREYVREINVGVKGSGTSLRFKMFDEIDREVVSDNLLVMVDGIPLSNPNKVFAMDPLKIKQLDIVNRNYILGTTVFRGLANFSSYNGSYEGLQLDTRAVTLDYEGLQLRREFYAPDYSSELRHNSRLPDLRSTLYWMPNVNTRQVNFYTGDTKGRYQIVLQGIDANGQPVYASSEIEVK